MEKIVKLDGKEVRMRVSARIPFLYREKFGRDVVTDMNDRAQKFVKAKGKTEQLSAFDLGIFENLAWCFAKNADKDIPEKEEWLDGMESMFAVYEILPEILELWTASSRTTSVPAKK